MSLLRDEPTLSQATSSSREVFGTTTCQRCSRCWAAEDGSAEGWSLQSSESKSLRSVCVCVWWGTPVKGLKGAPSAQWL